MSIPKLSFEDTIVPLYELLNSGEDILESLYTFVDMISSFL